MILLEVNDEVLVFNKYEGTILEITAERVLLYCPEFNEKEPYLVTTIANIQLLTKKLQN